MLIWEVARLVMQYLPLLSTNDKITIINFIWNAMRYGATWSFS